jgi:hypothetical protein
MTHTCILKFHESGNLFWEVKQTPGEGGQSNTGISCSAEQGMQKFPSGEVKIPLKPELSKAIQLKKGMQGEILVADENGRISSLMNGEIAGINYVKVENGEQTIEILLLSPFFKLEAIHVNQGDLVNVNSLRALLNEFKEKAHISAEILVEDDVPDEIDISYVKNATLLSILKLLVIKHLLCTSHFIN